ncbi:MAG: cytochrome-c peroxidase [Bacteroidetes bacterium]|nr:MAG: cytochrome-c peroxidase [Bacteroidota bacterium]
MRLLLFSVLFLALLGCRPDSPPDLEPDPPYVLDLPAGFPAPPIPEDNALTVSRLELGKHLFYDPILSRDSSLSCMSCHLPEAGFADHHPVSVGIEGRLGFRNSPTLTNVAYHPWFFKEGGSPSLEFQVLGPLENHVEMDIDAAVLNERLATLSHYHPLAQKAYGRDLDIYVLTRALASFQRTLISGDAPYDAYRRGETRALSAAQVRGMDLFFSDRTSCSACHGGFDFSTHGMENNGTERDYGADLGRFRITLDSADIGKFKVPTLRNIALTWPYMHDGHLPDLAAVIDHYNQGGQGHVNQSPLVRPLGLSEAEQADLVAFLESLTDQQFIENPAFRP